MTYETRPFIKPQWSQPDQRALLPEAVEAFRALACQKSFTHQLLLAEALNDLFEKHGIERLADERPVPRRRATMSKKVTT